MNALPYTQDTTQADSYVLDRTYSAASRLNLQHYLWNDALGFVLHPSIPRPTPGQRVADVGCGTAIWLFDLEAQLPAGVEYDGLDISLEQVPIDSYLPAHTRMRTWDVLGPVPDDLVGQFDVVHLRLILLVVRDNDPSTVIANLHKLLKPGGYLQWDELHNVDLWLIRTAGEGASQPTGATSERGAPILSPGNGGHYPPNLGTIRTMMSDRSKLSWAETLDTALNAGGFEGATRYRYTDRLPMLKANHQMLSVFCEEMVANITKTQGKEAADGFRKMLVGCEAETKEGWLFCVPKLVYVAKRK